MNSTLKERYEYALSCIHVCSTVYCIRTSMRLLTRLAAYVLTCIRNELHSETWIIMDFSVYQAANSWKPIPGMLRTCQKAIIITLRYTQHVYLKCLVERYGYIFSMKDYNC